MSLEAEIKKLTTAVEALIQAFGSGNVVPNRLTNEEIDDETNQQTTGPIEEPEEPEEPEDDEDTPNDKGLDVEGLRNLAKHYINRGDIDRAKVKKLIKKAGADNIGELDQDGRSKVAKALNKLS